MIWNDPMVAGPTFVLAPHRSGGTVLSRILNCHPALCIWGEHGGFINKLAEIEAVLNRLPSDQSPLANRRLAAHIASRRPNLTTFDPWISPLSLDAFRQWARDFIGTTFSKGLPPGTRWGFKEIRYHSVVTAEFLIRLFPRAQFVILRRDMLQLCISNLFAPWSRKELVAMGAHQDPVKARQAIKDCAYALATIDYGLQQIAHSYPDHSRVIRYEDLLSAPQPVVSGLFEFLGLTRSPAVDRKILVVLSVRSAPTDRERALGLLTAKLVERLAPRALGVARSAIAAQGVDLGRLKRLGHRGQYSFLVGDHQLRGTCYSSTF
jgi:hypothetical protein